MSDDRCKTREGNERISWSWNACDGIGNTFIGNELLDRVHSTDEGVVEDYGALC